MNNISMNQVLSIWDELWQAYYGDNAYGSDTAEIYAYRLMPYSPTLMLDGNNDKFRETDTYKKAEREIYTNAKISLISLLSKFEFDNNCRIEVNGLSIGNWAINEELFDYRCHIKIIKHIKVS